MTIQMRSKASWETGCCFLSTQPWIVDGKHMIKEWHGDLFEKLRRSSRSISELN